MGNEVDKEKEEGDEEANEANEENEEDKAASPSFEYVRIESGKCSDYDYTPIKTKRSCEAAAASIGHPDTKVKPKRYTDKPEGCHTTAEKLYLNIKESSIGIGNVDHRQQLCIKGMFHYTLNTGGSCRDHNLSPIMTEEGCEEAGFALGIPDNKAGTPFDPNGRPEGCYTKNDKLFINVDPGSAGNGNQGNSQQLCYIEENQEDKEDEAAEENAEDEAAEENEEDKEDEANE